QEAVEGGDVRAGRVQSGLERLDERRPRACERVEHVLSRPEVAAEQSLHELGDELAEVGMQTVHVLGPLPFGQVALGPGEVEPELAVEGILRRGHGLAVFAGWETSPRRG